MQDWYIFSQVRARPRADVSGYSAKAYTLMLLKKITLSSLLVYGQNKLWVRKLRKTQGTLVGDYLTTEWFNPDTYEMTMYGWTSRGR